MNLYGLPDIAFAEKAPDAIKRDIVARYEEAYFQATGERVTLYPGDPRRLFLLTIADIIVLQRNLIDYTGKQNMLAFADNANLDHLGLLLGVKRLGGSPALVTVRYALSAPLASAYIIPAGTRCTPDGKIFFASVEGAEIPPGGAYADVPSKCTETGASGNGFLPGQINRLVDPLPWVQGVENITESSGGADTEADEPLRERVHLAPESFSVAGPVGAYVYWARSASPLIGDVGVDSPAPGVVHVYPLLKSGDLPSPEILNQVLEILSADDIRPTSDYVQVLTPEPVEYNLDVTWHLDRANVTSAAAIRQAVDSAVDGWSHWQRTALGRDLNPSVLITRMVEAGAKRVTVSSPPFRALGFNQVAVPSTAHSVTYGGVEDG